MTQRKGQRTMKYKDFIKLLKEDGWYIVRPNRKRSGSSHVHYKHDVKSGKVTVSGKGNEEIKPGTLKSMLKQAGIK